MSNVTEDQVSQELTRLSVCLEGRRRFDCLALALKMLGEMPLVAAVCYIDSLSALASGENDCPELQAAIAALVSFEESQA